ncbi:MAG: HNH endonuclease [Spirosomataceae bacterium]
MTRQNIFKRDGHRCVYCGTHEDLTLDHVLPKSRGGRTSWDNLATACKRCNTRKGDRTPEEAFMPMNIRPLSLLLLCFAGFFGNNRRVMDAFLSKNEKRYIKKIAFLGNIYLCSPFCKERVLFH